MTDSEEAVCWPTVVVQGQVWQKNEGECWGNWDPWEVKPQF